MSMSLIEKIRKKEVELAVIGLGRVGLPLALAFASKGLRVMGVEKNPKLGEKIQNAESPFVEEGIQKLLKEETQKGRFSVVSSISQASGAEVILITVGTPLTPDLRPDLIQLNEVLHELCQNPVEGKLFVLRSTVPPGTTEGVVLELLREKAKKFYLAYCPERILEGKALKELETLPEIVGGIDRESSEAATELLKLLNPQKKILRTAPKVAELAKLFTNIYRYVNFALSNQFALVCEYYGVDAYEAIRVANEGYARSNIPLPGPAGGPCLYKDGYMLNYTPFIDFIKAAWHLNESLPLYLAERMRRELGSLLGKKVALLGLAFKADVDDDRDSPAVKLLNTLKAMGCKVHAHDPFLKPTPLEEVLSNADAVVLAVNHTSFKNLREEDISRLAKPNCLVVDCWGWFNPSRVKEVGLRYLGLGRGLS